MVGKRQSFYSLLLILLFSGLPLIVACSSPAGAEEIIEMYSLPLVKEKEAVVEKPVVKVDKIFADITEGNPLFTPLVVLSTLGIIKEDPTVDFRPQDPASRFFLAQVYSDLAEKVLLKGSLPLEPAGSLLAYKDVPSSDSSYPTIQKMIKLGALAGRAEGLFHGYRSINRFELASFSIKVLELTLAERLAFQTAPLEEAYSDISIRHWAFPYLQKLIWLGYKPYHEGNQFFGEKIVTRGELVAYTVDLLEALTKKIKALPRGKALRGPLNFSFSSESRASLDLSKEETLGVKSTKRQFGIYQNLVVDTSAYISDQWQGFATLKAYYYWGDVAAYGYPPLNLREFWIAYKGQPFLAQIGRQPYYLGFSPFYWGAGVEEEILDHLQLEYPLALGKISARLGRILEKTNYYSDFASLIYDGRIQEISWQLAGNYLTNPKYEPGNSAYGGFAAVRLNLPQVELGGELALFNRLEETEAKKAASLLYVTFYKNEGETSLGFYSPFKGTYQPPLFGFKEIETSEDCFLASLTRYLSGGVYFKGRVAVLTSSQQKIQGEGSFNWRFSPWALLEWKNGGQLYSTLQWDNLFSTLELTLSF